MAVEKFANVVVATTLSAGYTAGAGSISVTSASGFPTTGTFRVRLGNTAKTIYRVDSVSGTTFTGGAEANDGNANNGDSVTGVVSRGSMERVLQSPAAGLIKAPSGVAGVDGYGPIYSLPGIDQSAWSWVNQGSAAIVQTADTVKFTLPNDGSENVRARVVSAPGTPWTRTALVYTRQWRVNNIIKGIVLRESGTGKIQIFGMQTNGGGVRLAVRKDASPTSFTSENQVTLLSLYTTNLPPNLYIWLRVGDNATNLKYEYSFDGVYWTTHLDEARGTHFTTAPNEVGLGGINQGGSEDAVTTFLSFG